MTASTEVVTLIFQGISLHKCTLLGLDDCSRVWLNPKISEVMSDVFGREMVWTLLAALQLITYADETMIDKNQSIHAIHTVELHVSNPEGKNSCSTSTVRVWNWVLCDGRAQNKEQLYYKWVKLTTAIFSMVLFGDCVRHRGFGFVTFKESKGVEV